MTISPLHSQPLSRDPLSVILSQKLVPAVRVQTRRQVTDALQGLHEGGLLIAEIAMSAPAAMRLLEAALDAFGDTLLIGAGTVLDPETARSCLLAGCRFLVAPALNVRMIEVAHRYGALVIPGALTPTEVVAAQAAGAQLIKVFPASALGGPDYIRSLKAPLPHVRLMPMGGVSLQTAAAYLSSGASALGVGNDLVNLAELETTGTNHIAERTRALLQEIRSVQETNS